MTQITQMMAAGKIDPDAAAIIAAMTVPPNGARRTLINSTVLSLKAGGVWSLLDTIWFMAAHDEQAGRLNWKNPAAFTLTAVGAVAFEVDKGWARLSGVSYMETSWSASLNGANYKQNDASFGVYSRTNTAEAARDMGAVGDIWCSISARWSDNMTSTRNNNTGSDGPLRTSRVSSLGMFVARRPAANSQQEYVNGLFLGSNTQASGGLPVQSFLICAAKGRESINEYSTRQYALAFTGAAMSDAQHAQFYTIVQDYMTAVGAAV
jgi:hypothetical protein